MQVLWATTNSGGDKYRSEESQCHQVNGNTKCKMELEFSSATPAGLHKLQNL